MHVACCSTAAQRHSSTAAQQHVHSSTTAAHVQQHAFNQHNEEPAAAEQSPITTQGSKSQQFQASEKHIQARPDNQAPQLQVRATRWRKPAGGLPQNAQPPERAECICSKAAQQRSAHQHSSAQQLAIAAQQHSCTAAQQLHSNCNTATQQHMLATACTLAHVHNSTAAQLVLQQQHCRFSDWLLQACTSLSLSASPPQGPEY